MPKGHGPANSDADVDDGDISAYIVRKGAKTPGGNVGGGLLGALRPWQRSSPVARDGQVVVFVAAGC